MAKQAAEQQQQQQQDEWTQSMSQFRQAIEHNLTASRLVATGAIALGAAATAYFWDPSRRTAFLDSTRRLSGDMTNWWSGFSSGGTQQGGDAS